MAGENFAGAVNALFGRLDNNMNRHMENMDPANLLKEQYALEEARRALQADTDTRNALSGIQAMEDVPAALPGVIRSNPGIGIGLANSMSGLSNAATERDWKQQQRQVKMISDAHQMLSSLESDPDPQARAQNYPVVLRQVASMYPEIVPLIGKTIPTQYDPEWSRTTLQALIPAVERYKELMAKPYEVKSGENIETYQPTLGGRKLIATAPRKTEGEQKDNDITIFNKGIDERYQSEKGRPPTPAERLDEWSKYKAQGKQTVSISVEQPLSGADEGLAQMLAKGELAPAELGKRTGNYNAVLARAKNINPDFNPKQADMDYGAGKTSGFRLKDITIQAMPQILRTVVDAGKDLDFSPIRFVGIAQAWKNKQLNDPAQVKYMALRNDALMSIAGVMRGVSATDQAHRVEIEAMEPTLPPKALEAWLEGQMESLKPRLKQFDQIYGRDKATQEKGGSEASLPPISAFSDKPEGEPIRFKNGQVWTIKDGKQVRLPKLEGQ